MTAGWIRCIPNTITLMRPALTFVLLSCILRGDMASALTVCIAAGMTDIFDGMAARALKTCTRLGAYMDVGFDLLFVMASLIVLNLYHHAPPWFTVVTALKFTEFAITSRILKKRRKGQEAWVFDDWGRGYGVSAFLAPGVFCLIAMRPESLQPIRIAFLVVSCTLAIVSSAARVTRCAQQSLQHRSGMGNASVRSANHSDA